MALQIGAFSNNQEDYGMYILYGLPQAPSTSENLLTEIDAEIVKLQTELISDKELQKLQNKYENQYVNSNASEGVADNLATYYMLYKDLINTEICTAPLHRKRLELLQKKSKSNQRLVLDYVPSSDKAKIIQNHHEKTIYISSLFLTLAMQAQIIPQPKPQLLRQLRLVNPIILS
jgi:hypothetical protein